MGVAEVLIASALTAGTQAATASRARKDAKVAAKDQESAQRQAMAKEKDRLAVADADKMRDAQSARLKAGAAKFGGRQSTILTGGPRTDVLGGAGAVGSGNKTLLGV